MADYYRDLIVILQKNGAYFVRAGSHEIWFSPVSGKNVTVPRTTKARHTANEVLKQAGLPKAF